MCAVFERVLQMDKGKALVGSHVTTADAQKMYSELCEDALRSTHSSIGSLLRGLGMVIGMELPIASFSTA